LPNDCGHGTLELLREPTESAPPVAWPDDLIILAQWALQQEDLRHRFLRASNAASILRTSGLDAALETAVVLRIYEAAIAKGYSYGSTIDYERAYTPDSGKNGQRVDLAFKEQGIGQNWGFVEVKYYGPGGVQGDIQKLKNFPNRIQRWMFVYRVVATKTGGKGAPIQALDVLMNKYGSWAQVHQAEFETVAVGGSVGKCQMFLGRLG
jgi:hypothetical protein